MKQRHDSGLARCWLACGITLGLVAASLLLWHGTAVRAAAAPLAAASAAAGSQAQAPDANGHTYLPLASKVTSCYLPAAQAKYPAIAQTALNTCQLCHSSGSTLNKYGSDFRANGASFTAIEARDSDGDGYGNLEEINAGTFPGDAASKPQSKANAFFVAPGGNDSNPGTEAAPWRTVGKAAASARAGATAYFKAGTYGEKLRPANSGTAGAPITFAAYPGHTVILDGSQAGTGNTGMVDLAVRNYIVIAGLTIRNSDAAGILADRSQHIVIRGNHTVHSQASGIGVWNSVDVVVDGNDVEDSNFGGGNEAISVGISGPFEIKNNRVHNPSSSSTLILKEGIDIKQGSHDGSVHHNEVYQIQKPALYIDAFDQHTYNMEIYANRIHDVRMGITLASELGGLLENIRVYNNLVWNVYYAGIRTFGVVDTADHRMQNITYSHNTVYNSGTGINVSNDQITNFLVANNIVSHNKNGLELARGVSVTFSRNLIDGASSARGSTDLTGDPLFVAAASADFHLRSGSPAIDHGGTAGAVEGDFDGAGRPQGGGYDIGAYEAH